jgi:hypothetical protein
VQKSRQGTRSGPIGQLFHFEKIELGAEKEMVRGAKRDDHHAAVSFLLFNHHHHHHHQNLEPSPSSAFAMSIR